MQIIQRLRYTHRGASPSPTTFNKSSDGSLVQSPWESMWVNQRLQWTWLYLDNKVILKNINLFAGISHIEGELNSSLNRYLAANNLPYIQCLPNFPQNFCIISANLHRKPNGVKLNSSIPWSSFWRFYMLHIHYIHI